MAEIRTAISIGDGFTPNLRKLERGLGAVLSTYQSLAKAFGKPLHLKVSKSTVTKLKSETAELGKTQLKTNEALNRSANSFRRAANGAYAAATAYSRFNRVAQQLNGTLRGLPRGRRSFGTPKFSESKSGKSNSMANAVNEANKKQRLFNTSLLLGSSAALRLHSNLKSIAAAYATLKVGQTALTFADTNLNTRTRLGMANRDPNISVDEFEKQIFQAAERSRSGYFETAKFINRIAQGAPKIFKTNDQLLTFAETIQKYFGLGGASVEEMNSAVIQLTQALGSGKLQGDELRSIAENAPMIKNAIADYMGIDAGQIYDIAAKGKISAEIVRNAILKNAEDIDQKFKKMPKTFAQLWTSFKNYANFAFKGVAQKLSEFGNSKAMQRMFELATIAVFALGKAIEWALDRVADFANLIYRNLDVVIPILGAVAAGYIALGAAMLYSRAAAILSAAAIWINTASMIAYSFVLGGLKGAAAAATAAQWSLTAAMLANPVGLILIIIVALIAAVFGVIAAYNAWTDSSVSAVGTICGGLNVVWETVKTVAVGLGYAFASAWYGVKAAFWETIAALDEGWHNFCIGFADTMIDACNVLIKAWNKLRSLWGEGEVALLHYGEDKYESAVRKYAEEARKNQEEIDAKGHALKFNFSEWYDKGNNWGTGLQNKVTDYINKFDLGKTIKDAQNALGILEATGGNLAKPDYGAILDSLGSIDKNTGQTAKNTGGLDINSEEIVWMREIGEREAVNRFTTAEVKVEVVNNNNLKSSLDINQLMDKFTEKLREGVLTAADAVHY